MQSTDTYIANVLRESAYVAPEALATWLDEKIRNVAVRARAAETRRCLAHLRLRLSDNPKAVAENEKLLAVEKGILGGEWP